ncbi:MAG: energy transducer TonB [Candidatus Omnitrophota bacterium]
MFSNRLFKTAFFVSLFAHGIILFYNSNLNIPVKNKQPEILEIKYLDKIREEKKYEKTTNSKQEPFLKLPDKIISPRLNLNPVINNEDLFKNVNRPEKQYFPNPIKERYKQDSLKPNFQKPALLKPEIMSIKKKIILTPPKDLNKIDSPAYLSYSQISREKIRRILYENYSGSSEQGVVFVSFTISNSGKLMGVRILDDKSSKNLCLREIAIESIKEASPFPPFPKELDYSQVPFTVEIAFETE